MSSAVVCPEVATVEIHFGACLNDNTYIPHQSTGFSKSYIRKMYQLLREPRRLVTEETHGFTKR